MAGGGAGAVSAGRGGADANAPGAGCRIGRVTYRETYWLVGRLWVLSPESALRRIATGMGVTVEQIESDLRAVDDRRGGRP